uniref:Uncharacterized protein n=1 Tax=Nonomuraea gerenzanensis TaxID=93944 RepID=A0A1M4DZM2_9ACTN|nr:hypothetical protein BN4615_P1527 [Nonomuraea gerenzanensis]
MSEDHASAHRFGSARVSFGPRAQTKTPPPGRIRMGARRLAQPGRLRPPAQPSAHA